jgi:hypothetical protein
MAGAPTVVVGGIGVERVGLIGKMERGMREWQTISLRRGRMMRWRCGMPLA